MSLDALYILDMTLNATRLEREGVLATVALRAAKIHLTANRSEVCSHSIEPED